MFGTAFLLVALASAAPPEEERGAEAAVLARQLHKGDTASRRAAALALTRLDAAGLAELVKAAEGDGVAAEVALEALANMGPVRAKAALPAARRALGHKEAAVRFQAAWAVHRLGGDTKSALAALGRGLRDSDRDVARSALEVIDRMGPSAKDAIPDLIVALKGRDPFLRQAAMVSLGRMGGAAAKPLAAVLDHDEPAVRRAAAIALGRIGPPARAAAFALQARLDKETAPPVRKALDAALLRVLLD
jgi:HEAT repeat protein